MSDCQNCRIVRKFPLTKVKGKYVNLIQYCPLHAEAKTMSQWLANLARAAQKIHDAKGDIPEQDWVYLQYIITAAETSLKRANKKENKK